MSGGLNTFNRVVPAGGVTKIAAVGGTIFIAEAASSLKVRVKHGRRTNYAEDKGESVVRMGAGDKQVFGPDLYFYELLFENDSGADISLVAIIGYGDFERPPSGAEVPGTVTGANVVALSSGGFEEIAANPNRKAIYIESEINNPYEPGMTSFDQIRVRFGTTSGPLNFFLAPGEGIYFEYTGLIRVYGGSGVYPQRFSYLEIS